MKIIKRRHLLFSTATAGLLVPQLSSCCRHWGAVSLSQLVAGCTPPSSSAAAIRYPPYNLTRPVLILFLLVAVSIVDLFPSGSALSSEYLLILRRCFCAFRIIFYPHIILVLELNILGTFHFLNIVFSSYFLPCCYTDAVM